MSYIQDKFHQQQSWRPTTDYLMEKNFILFNEKL